MTIDDGWAFWNRRLEDFMEFSSEISFPDDLSEIGLEARTMQNNKPRRVVEYAAELTKTSLPLYVLEGRLPGMYVASEIMRGVVIGYDAVTPMRRFQVAHSMLDVADALVVAELSRLVMPPGNAPMTWKKAADLVGVPESTLHSRYARRVFNPQAKA